MSVLGVFIWLMQVNFRLCSGSCVTCSALTTETSFVSSSNGGEFYGSYEFADGEEPVITCTTVNLIHLLQCDNCGSQYVGETARDLKQRIYKHRSTAKPNNKTTGNFRLRQHYACSGGLCKQFKIFVIQKLPGSGRITDEKL